MRTSPSRAIRASLRLRAGGQLADVVEKERPADGRGHAAVPRHEFEIGRLVSRARACRQVRRRAKQQPIDAARVGGAAVDHDERRVRAAAASMQLARDRLDRRSGLAGNEGAGVAAGRTPQQFLNARDGVGSADELDRPGPGRGLAGRARVCEGQGIWSHGFSLGWGRVALRPVSYMDKAARATGDDSKDRSVSAAIRQDAAIDTLGFESHYRQGRAVSIRIERRIGGEPGRCQSWRRGSTGPGRGPVGIGGSLPVEETVQEKRQSDDHEEPPDAKGGRGAFAGERDEHHQPEADAHQRDARAAVAPGRADAVAIVAIHRPVEAVRIDLGRRHQPFFDHRDPLADFELAHARAGQRRDNSRGERPDNGDDRNEKRPRHEVLGNRPCVD